MSNKTICSACGVEFDVDLPACPECGSGDRNSKVFDSVNARDDLRIKGFTSNPIGGKPLLEFLSKTKLSGKTKSEAIEKVTRDRSQGETKVKHQVWEEDDQGNMRKVHDHYKD